VSEIAVPSVFEVAVTDADLAVFAGEGMTFACPTFHVSC
jgi:hypothetical protein